LSDDPWSADYVKEAEEATFECDAVVVDAKIEDKEMPKGGTAKYLMLQLKPTSYGGDNMNAQYKIAKQKSGKWVYFLKALRACGVTGSGPEALIGKEFHWKRILIKTFKDQETGEDVEMTVMTPTKLLSGQTAQPHTPAPAVPAQQGTTAHVQVSGDDVQTKILNFIKMKGGTTRSEISKELGIKMPDLIKSLSKLKEAKQVVDEGGAILPA